MKTPLRLGKVQKRLSYIVGLVIILLFGSSIISLADSDLFPIGSEDSEDAADMTRKEVLTARKSHSLPRNQVLLEIATATW